MKYTHLLGTSADWSALERQIAALPDAKDRGDAFEEFCEAYLRLIPIYHFKNIWLQGHFPRWVIDKLRLSGQQDQGIDLVAFTDDRNLWAIQAKFRSDRAETVSYRELSTFLGISDQADYRLIISNTRTLPTVVQRRGRCGEVLVDRLEALDPEFFTRLKDYAKKHQIRPFEIYTPKDHQTEAIREAKKHFSKNDRGQLIMACGSGKTLTSVWISEALKTKKVLVMVPSIALMRQTLSVWARNYRLFPFQYLCVCSDKSVASDTHSDYATGHLWEMDLPVTTNPKEATKFLQQHKDKPFILFSTYQSSAVLSKAVLKSRSFQFDLMICDEAHRTAGSSQSLFNLPIDDKYLPSKKRLFMTATPRLLGKHIIKRGIEEDVPVFSMNDEKKYGKEFYHLSFGRAIKDKLLTDYKVIIICVSDKETNRLIAERKKILIPTRIPHSRDAHSLAKQIAFIKAVSKQQIKHTISFHSRVEFAKRFQDPDNACGIPSVNQLMRKISDRYPLLNAFHVNGSMPSSERSDLIRDFVESEYSVVSNARCLTEGVDIPAVDGVLFYDPKYSKTDIVQALGRAIRKHPGKKIGYIIVPVFIGKGTDPETVLESEDFSYVWEVAKAIQAHDARLEDVIEKMRVISGQIAGGNKELRSRQRSLEEKLFERIQIIDIPSRISFKKIASGIQVQLLERLGYSWDYQFGVLLEFIKKHPNRWPSRWEEYPKGNNLGDWCVTQRQYFKKGVLPRNKIEALSKIKFPWDIKAENWLFQYENLRDFRKKNPTRWPKRNEQYPRGNYIGEWCVFQRQLFGKGMLSKTRFELLDKIHFRFEKVWKPWTFFYEHLISFRKKNPNRWPQGTEQYPKGIQLGAWCKEQRTKMRNNQLPKQQISKKRGQLTGQQIALLNKIKFPWSVLDEVWMTQYGFLINFRRKYPDRWPKVREQYPKGNYLGQWLTRQPRNRKLGKLSQEQIALLDEIDFHWNNFSDRWMNQYNHLLSFRKNNPHRWPSPIEQYPKGNNLGNWVAHQRAARKNGGLHKSRIKLLNRIKFIWNLQRKNKRK